MGAALSNEGNLAWHLGDRAGARGLYARALDIWRELKDEQAAARVLNNIGMVACEQQDWPACQTAFQESIDLRRRLGDTRGVAAVELNWAAQELRRGNGVEARTLLDRCTPVFEACRDSDRLAACWSNLANAAFLSGDATESLRYARLALSSRVARGDLPGASMALLRAAFAAHALRDLAAAAHALAMAALIRVQTGSCLDEADRAQESSVLKDLRASLGDEAVSQIWGDAGQTQHGAAILEAAGSALDRAFGGRGA